MRKLITGDQGGVKSNHVKKINMKEEVLKERQDVKEAV